MQLRNRAPGIEAGPSVTVEGLEHLEDSWIAVLRWLQSNRVDFVLVGPVAQAVRGDAGAKGPVAIVPAPYGRNLERLSRALWSAHARLRVDGQPDTVAVKLSTDKLANGTRWALRCGVFDLDVEGRLPGVPRYQELLYEARRFELATECSVEVASPEDLGHYGHVRAAELEPEIRISRASPAQ